MGWLLGARAVVCARPPLVHLGPHGLTIHTIIFLALPRGRGRRSMRATPRAT